jgi:hypothetical protein
MGIIIASGFDIGSANPVDSRYYAATTTVRDAIDVNKRYQGLTTFCADTQKNYQLRGGTANGNWVSLDDFGNDILSYDAANRKYTPYTDANRGAGRFYSFSSNYPSNSTGLAYDGNFFVSNIRAGGASTYTEMLGSLATIQIVVGGAGKVLFNPTVADSGSNMAHVFDTSNTLTSGRKLLGVNNNGATKFYVDYNGDLFVGNTASDYFSYKQDSVWGIASGGGGKMVLSPFVADGGTAIAYIFSTKNSLTTTAKLFEFQNNGVSTFYLNQGGFLALREMTAPSATPAAGFGYIYSDAADSKLKYKNDAGTVYDMCIGTAGAQISGTPANDYLAVWTNATTLEGISALQWDGSRYSIAITSSPESVAYGTSFIQSGAHANAFPLNFFKSRGGSSCSVGDKMLRINASFVNSTSTSKEETRLEAKVTDVTNGTEDTTWSFWRYVNGTAIEYTLETILAGGTPPTSDVLEWSSGKYTPYSNANKAAGRFYTYTSTLPTNSTELAWDGTFRAYQLNTYILSAQTYLILLNNSNGGGAVQINTGGSATDINLDLVSKGTGAITLNSGAGTASMSVTSTSWAAHTNSGSYYLGDSGHPVASGTTSNVLYYNTSTGQITQGAAPSGGVTLSGSTDNTICTVTGANAIQGESTLTYDGSVLSVAPTGVTAQKLILYSSSNYRYGLGIQSSEFRSFFPSDTGFISFGTISVSDGTTWAEKMRLSKDGNLSLLGSFTTMGSIPSSANIELVTQGAGLIMKDETSATRWHVHMHGDRIRAYNGSTEHVYVTTGDTIGNATYASYAGYLPTAYIGGQQTNPQTYFSNTIGLKVAMTGSWSVWSDTVWINGYSGSDVKSMVAMHFLRNGTPRMALSVQNHDATSYGSYYEVITTYNIASQTVSTASYLGSYYTADTWLRTTGDGYQWKLYGNSRTVVMRTDGVTNDDGGGGYAFIWKYGGSADGNRVMILHTNGQLWVSSLGWLDSAATQATSYFATAGHTHNYAGSSSSGGAATNCVVNNGNDSNSTYYAVWHSGNTLYSTNGIYFQPYYDYVYASNFILTSDERLKTKIQDIIPEYIDVTYKSFVMKSAPGQFRYGVIAQEVAKKHSELVRIDCHDYLSVMYIDLFSREMAWLKPTIKSHEERINELEKELKYLKGLQNVSS